MVTKSVRRRRGEAERRTTELTGDRNRLRVSTVYKVRSDAMGESAVQVPANPAAERLLIEAAQRDPSRFGDLYEYNFERVYAFIARRVGDRDTAEDLTADVFHQALANLSRFEWRG